MFIIKVRENKVVTMSGVVFRECYDGLFVEYEHIPDRIKQTPNRYLIKSFDTTNNDYRLKDEEPIKELSILFQNGLSNKDCPNGVTIEALLDICKHRLECFQKGDFPSEYNAKALECISAAIVALNQRHADRIERGVDGTHKA